MLFNRQKTVIKIASLSITLPSGVLPCIVLSVIVLAVCLTMYWTMTISLLRFLALFFNLEGIALVASGLGPTGGTWTWQNNFFLSIKTYLKQTFEFAFTMEFNPVLFWAGVLLLMVGTVLSFIPYGGGCSAAVTYLPITEV